MRKVWISGVLLAVLGCNAYGMNKVIYGDDDRLEVFQETDSLFLSLASSTAGMISSAKLVRGDDDQYTITGTLLGAGRNICMDENYTEQITAANCSGFLVGDDLLVTAGHCMRSQSNCTDYKWVFGFAVDYEGKTEFSVPPSDVYGCKEILGQTLDSFSKNDYAIIRLDRKVIDRTPLSFRREGKIADNASLVVIGHPTGLPLKIAAGANVRTNTNQYYFVANLDTFAGNSGSPVFDAQTGMVEGILVRGENDYVRDPVMGCKRPKRCASDGCRGEDVTRIEHVKELFSLL